MPDWQYEVNVYLGYFYFLSKIVDFSDTFFFVLVSSSVFLSLMIASC